MKRKVSSQPAIGSGKRLMMANLRDLGKALVLPCLLLALGACSDGGKGSSTTSSVSTGDAVITIAGQNSNPQKSHARKAELPAFLRVMDPEVLKRAHGERYVPYHKGGPANDAEYINIGLGVRKANYYGIEGLLDDKSILKTNFVYSGIGRLEPFKNGDPSTALAPYFRDGLWGYMNGDGKEVVPPKFLRADNFERGLALALRRDGSWEIVGEGGRTVKVMPTGFARTVSPGKAYFVVLRSYNFDATKGEKMELVLPGTNSAMKSAQGDAPYDTHGDARDEIYARDNPANKEGMGICRYALFGIDLDRPGRAREFCLTRRYDKIESRMGGKILLGWGDRGFFLHTSDNQRLIYADLVEGGELKLENTDIYTRIVVKDKRPLLCKCVDESCKRDVCEPGTDIFDVDPDYDARRLMERENLPSYNRYDPNQLECRGRSGLPSDVAIDYYSPSKYTVHWPDGVVTSFKGYEDIQIEDCVRPGTPNSSKFGKHAFSDGYALVKKDGLWGYIDKKGNPTTGFRWVEALPFTNDFAFVRGKTGEWAKIDRFGRNTTPYIFDEVSRIDGVLSPVKRNGYWCYMNPKGKVVIPCVFAEAESFKGWSAKVRLEPNGEMFLIGVDGRPYSPLEASSLANF